MTKNQSVADSPNLVYFKSFPVDHSVRIASWRDILERCGCRVTTEIIGEEVMMFGFER